MSRWSRLDHVLTSPTYSLQWWNFLIWRWALNFFFKQTYTWSELWAKRACRGLNHKTLHYFVLKIMGGEVNTIKSYVLFKVSILLFIYAFHTAHYHTSNCNALTWTTGEGINWELSHNPADEVWPSDGHGEQWKVSNWHSNTWNQYPHYNIHLHTLAPPPRVPYHSRVLLSPICIHHLHIIEVGIFLQWLSDFLEWLFYVAILFCLCFAVSSVPL